MTSFYMFRLWFKTFFGEPRFEQTATLEHHGAPVHARSTTTLTMVADPDEDHAAHSHGVHESPWIMLFPLVILAILSFIGGLVGVPAACGGHNEIEHFLDPVFASGTAAAAVASTGGRGLELGLAAISVLTAAARLLHRVPLLLQEARHGGRARTPREARIYGPREQVLGRRVLHQLSGHSAADVYARRSGTSSSIAESSTARAARPAWLHEASPGPRGRRSPGNIRSYAGWLAIGRRRCAGVMIFGRSLWMHL